MKSQITVTWVGKSGSKYLFHVYPLNEKCPAEAGIYMFCNGVPNAQGIHLTAIYIGMAASFDERMYNHHKMDCAKKNGANYICLMNVPNEQLRISVEKDLLDAIPTKCNEVNNPVTPK